MTQRTRRSRVPQPPVNRFRRDRETHRFWPAAVVAFMAAGMLFNGARQPTGLVTQDGESASEYQLIRAFARGGLHLDQASFTFDPAMFDDPARLAAELDRANRLADRPLRERYRVNTGAVDPCPT